MRARSAPVLGGPVLLGVVLGLAWWVLAPTAEVARTADGTLVALSAPELAAAQDGVFALLAAATGAVCGVVTAVRPGRTPLRRSLLVLAASAAGVALAVGLGHLLGPDPVAAQLRVHPDGPVTSPLRVHSVGAWLVWPEVAALVMGVGHAVAARRRSRELAAAQEEAGNAEDAATSR